MRVRRTGAPADTLPFNSERPRNSYQPEEILRLCILNSSPFYARSFSGAGLYILLFFCFAALLVLGCQVFLGTHWGRTGDALGTHCGCNGDALGTL